MIRTLDSLVLRLNLVDGVKQIAYSEQLKRLNGITNQLDAMEVSYKIQSSINNVIVSFNPSNNRTVFVAHWDSVNTPGANDNAAACSILLELIKHNKNTTKSVDFVFTNKEETGFVGASEYIRHVGFENIKCVINLDMCGMGTNIVTTSNHLVDDDLFGNLFTLDTIYNNELSFTSSVPACDDCVFTHNNIPNTTIVLATDKDLQFYKGVISRSETDFNKTMHTVNDTLDTLTVDGMEKLFNYLNSYFNN